MSAAYGNGSSSSSSRTNTNTNTNSIHSTKYLKGHIEHKTTFVDDAMVKRRGRKRKYKHNNFNHQYQEEEDEEEEIFCEDCKNVGFFFTGTYREGENKNTLGLFRCVRIIVPHMMLKAVCDSVRFRKEVTLCKYSIVTLVDENSGAIERSSQVEVKFLELHHNGLLVHPHPDSSSTIDLQSKINNATPSISLSEAHRLEENIEIERQKSKDQRISASKKIASSRRFNIRGTVDAISAIISVVPKDPFALIELYDKKNPSISAIVILKGLSALTCQPGILPGDDITFSNVIRSKWHVPQSFRKADVPHRLHSRAPSHVFVVTNCKSIVWEASINDVNNHHSPLNLCTGDAEISQPTVIVPPLPSTIDSLSSLHGKVVAVQYSYIQRINGAQSHQQCKRVNNAAGSAAHASWHPRHVHHIVVEEDNGSPIRKNRYKIYLLYYPMSPDLYFGLVIGSFVRAINIHPMSIPSLQLDRQRNQGNDDHNYLCFGACLRSTITILTFSSDDHFLKFGQQRYHQDKCHNGNKTPREKEPCFITQKDVRRSTHCSIISQNQFYIFSNIKMSYIEREWMSQVKSYAFERLGCISDIYSALQICMSRCRNPITKSNGNFQYSRDPYKEWFDHCCENEESEESFFNCPSSPIPKQFFPTVVNLCQLRSVCMDKMQNVLSNNSIFRIGSNVSSSPVRVGWSASIVFNNSQLHELLYLEKRSPSIQLGGIVVESNDTKTAIGQIHNGFCQLPLIPIAEHGDSSQSRNLSRTGSFVMITVRNIVVSSFYLGMKNCTGSEDVDLIKMLPLPPLVPCESSITIGACELSSFRGHIFINSIQIHHDEGQMISVAESNSSSHVDHSKSQVSDNGPLRKSPVKVYPLTKYICNQSAGNKINGEICFVGRLTSLQWRAYNRLRKHIFKGCILTLSSVPINRELKDNFVSNQSVDLKLNVPLDDDVIKKTTIAINTFSSSKFVQDIVSLASAWRTLAEESRFCPIVICKDASCKTTHTDVLFPVNESMIKNREVSIDAIQVIVKDVLENKTQEKNDPTIIVAGERRLPGTLLPRQNRRGIQNSDKNVCGENVLPVENFHGIPTLNISALTYRLLHNMTMKQPGTQLVWRIPDARVLTLKFCCVRIECTRCFKYLINNSASEIRDVGHTVLDGERNNEDVNISFWDKSVPIEWNAKHTDQSKTIERERVHPYNLSCPSGCGRHYAAPKWELSGIVDDGTGTAKLYAERDAALMLLGQGLDIQLIEKAAWSSSNGIVFQRGVHLDTALKNKIQQVHRLSSRERTGLTINNGLIDTRGKGVLELYQYCLESKEIQRKLDMICCCKKLSEEKFILNPVDIPVVSALGLDGKAIHSNFGSFRSPILELKLVDSVRSLEQASEMGWSIVSSVL